jgi:hypothetical protein
MTLKYKRFQFDETTKESLCHVCITDVVRFWLSETRCAKFIHEKSDATMTEFSRNPFLFMNNLQQTDRLKYGSYATGTRWYECFSDCVGSWRSRLTGDGIFKIKSLLTLDVFIHLLWFVDAYGSSRKLKSVGHEAHLVSCSEFPDNLLWSEQINPFVVPVCIYSSKIKRTAKPNEIMALFTDDLIELSKGVDMYSVEKRKTVRVFVSLHAILGDLVARLEIGIILHLILAGWKNHLNNYPCYVCDIKQKDIMESFKNAENSSNLLSEEEMKRKAETLNNSHNSGNDTGLSYRTGNNINILYLIQNYGTGPVSS